MYKSTIKTLKHLQIKSAHEIAASNHPETNIRISRVYLPIYEISAVLLLAAQRVKNKHHLLPDDRAALTLIKSRIKDLQISVQRIHYVPGYPFADRITEVQEMQADVSALEAIVTDLLS